MRVDARPKERVRFDHFDANLDTGELRKHGLRIKLQDQPFQILAMLLANPGEMVTRESIQQRLWPDGTFVDFENGMNRAVNRLRDALGDSAEKPKFIETIPRRGYRFIGVVERPHSEMPGTIEASASNGIAVAETAQHGGNSTGGVAACQQAMPAIDEARTVISETLRGAPDVGTSVGTSTGQQQESRVQRALRRTLAVLLLTAVVSSILYWRLAKTPTRTVVYSHPTPKLTDRDTIVVADFANKTGDPVFDGTLRQGLSIQLEQSPFLRSASDQRIQKTLSLMGQPADAKLTLTLAREICHRTASAVILDGSIAQIGTQYLLMVRAINCASGETVASTEAQAGDKNHVLDALGRAASKIRSELGESPSTLQKFSTPLEEATTTSLEALQAYSLGWRTMTAKGDYAAAVPFFERAIRLDPRFAMAHAVLGIVLSSEENAAKAYELREGVSEKERYYIESHYFQVAGHVEKARQVYELWALTYPRDWVPLNQLGNIYKVFGQYEKALDVYSKAADLEPTSSLSYTNVVATLVALNRFKEARAAAEEMRSKNLDSPGLHFVLFDLDFLENDTAGMAKTVEWAAGRPETQRELLMSQTQTAAFWGKLKNAREFSQRAIELAEPAERKETMAAHKANAALFAALLGKASEARTQAKESFATDVQYSAVLALALAGETKQSQEVANELANRLPNDPFVRYELVPAIHALIALDKGDASASIEALGSATIYETGIESRLFPAYVRGVAYLAAHQGSLAAIEFQKILDHRGIVGSDLIGALAHLQLGRAYSMQGDTAKAKAAYQDLLTLWKDADPDIPILKQAKLEYAKLQ